MAAGALAYPAERFGTAAGLFSTTVPNVRTSALRRARAARGPRRLSFRRSGFGELTLAVFLLAQCLDGVLTYMGVAALGIGMEGNPIVAALMTHLGHGLGLLSAKVLAGALGICLHVCQIHAVVALLAGFYLTVAIAPWTMILFF